VCFRQQKSQKWEKAGGMEVEAKIDERKREENVYACFFFLRRLPSCHVHHIIATSHSHSASVLESTYEWTVSA
jgi:hypothetical protein